MTWITLCGKGRSRTKHDEVTPLLCDYKGRSYVQNIEVAPMQHDDLVKATDTTHRAFLKEALMVYFSSADTRPFREARNKAQYYLSYDDAIHKQRMLTVNKADALMRYSTPGDPKGLTRWRTFLTALIDKLDNRELAKRKKEVEGKIGAMVEDAFGEKVKDMYEVQALATAPEAQGRGYGSALVTAVTDMGDADGHDVWLITSDAYGFYETLGFSVIRLDFVGADNPKWKGKPVGVRIMYRPAKTANAMNEKRRREGTVEV
ncbi:hypothetical protein GY45DRAFT_1316924 [Cubamyces sp. BRFM 1775]|nr:hypothetical protein GY45DRAFT_1316924 [Cubamyces sp. BRFM 1775]